MSTIAIPNFLTQKIVNGLNNYQYTVKDAAVHNCRIEINHSNSSGLTVSIVQAGSKNATLATATLPNSSSMEGQPQGTFILSAASNCAIGDTLTFQLSSSSAID